MTLRVIGLDYVESFAHVLSLSAGDFFSFQSTLMSRIFLAFTLVILSLNVPGVLRAFGNMKMAVQKHDVFDFTFLVQILSCVDVLLLLWLIQYVTDDVKYF